MTMTAISSRYFLHTDERNWVLDQTSHLLKENTHRIVKRDITQGFRCIPSHWESPEGCYAKNFGSEDCGKHGGKWGLLLIEHLSDEIEDIVFSEEEDYDHVDIVCDLLNYDGNADHLDWMFSEEDPEYVSSTVSKLRYMTEHKEIIQDIDIEEVMKIAYSNMEENFAEANISSVRLS